MMGIADRSDVTGGVGGWDMRGIGRHSGGMNWGGIGQMSGVSVHGWGGVGLDGRGGVCVHSRGGHNSWGGVSGSYDSLMMHVSPGLVAVGGWDSHRGGHMGGVRQRGGVQEARGGSCQNAGHQSR